MTVYSSKLTESQLNFLSFSEISSHLRFYDYAGQQQSFLIDNNFPCSSKGKSMLSIAFDRFSNPCLFLPLIEKGLASMYGSYSDLNNLSICQLFNSLTGGYLVDFHVLSDNLSDYFQFSLSFVEVSLVGLFKSDFYYLERVNDKVIARRTYSHINAKVEVSREFPISNISNFNLFLGFVPNSFTSRKSFRIETCSNSIKQLPDSLLTVNAQSKLIVSFHFFNPIQAQNWLEAPEVLISVWKRHDDHDFDLHDVTSDPLMTRHFFSGISSFILDEGNYYIGFHLLNSEYFNSRENCSLTGHLLLIIDIQ
ncbi:hypothetical protein GEMRC1_010372 [Eukaryota sp. GEM-RC1]